MGNSNNRDAINGSDTRNARNTSRRRNVSNDRVETLATVGVSRDVKSSENIRATDSW
jgi:hypothetical protein